MTPVVITSIGDGGANAIFISRIFAMRTARILKFAAFTITVQRCPGKQHQHTDNQQTGKDHLAHPFFRQVRSSNLLDVFIRHQGSNSFIY